MVFGKQQSAPEAAPPGSASANLTRDRFVTFLLSVFLGLMLTLSLVGCGSGSGGNNNNGGNNGSTNTGSNGGSTQTRLIGRVVNQNNNNAAVAGATVSYAGVTGATDNGGSFSLAVPSGQTANLVVAGPANADGTAGYYNTGYVGSQQYSLGSTGYPVTPLTAGETRDVGTVIIFSQTGPPPPPIFSN